MSKRRRKRQVEESSGMAAGVAAGLGIALLMAWRRRTRYSFRNRSVFITGGSRGLGLVLARQLARKGARLTILARDEEELARAVRQLRGMGAELLPLICDVRSQEQVFDAVNRAVERFGGVDVLINNAGIIQVGPFEHMSIRDFEDALAVHLFGPLFCTLAALPHMRRAGGGRIVNISSIGGKIAVPHLLPYSASKFALVGLSDGLRAELRRDNIRVTTVCPGLMRTGSQKNAWFKGQHRREYAWFAIGGSMPLLSTNSERAARRILQAARRGSARLVIGAQMKGAVIASELFPESFATAMSWTSRLLPDADSEQGDDLHPGHESEGSTMVSRLTRLSEAAARRNNELKVES